MAAMGGRLRAIKLFLWLHGSAEYIKIGLWRVERLKIIIWKAQGVPQ